MTRGITLKRLPVTLRYLPPTKPAHHPAMICPFGMPTEPEPGVLTIDEQEIVGIHLTLLKPDGSGKADSEPSKVMVGPSLGSPIVLVSMNDQLGLTISEGIEDALSAYAGTGLGAWAAGSASRLPPLSDVVPDHASSITIICDDDDAGRGCASDLAARLYGRKLFVELMHQPMENAA